MFRGWLICPNPNILSVIIIGIGKARNQCPKKGVSEKITQFSNWREAERVHIQALKILGKQCAREKKEKKAGFYAGLP
jgi:hypothetical protein